jgi:hypothetical protein
MIIGKGKVWVFVIAECCFIVAVVDKTRFFQCVNTVLKYRHSHSKTVSYVPV